MLFFSVSVYHSPLTSLLSLSAGFLFIPQALSYSFLFLSNLMIVAAKKNASSYFPIFAAFADCFVKRIWNFLPKIMPDGSINIMQMQMKNQSSNFARQKDCRDFKKSWKAPVWIVYSHDEFWGTNQHPLKRKRREAYSRRHIAAHHRAATGVKWSLGLFNRKSHALTSLTQLGVKKSTGLLWMWQTGVSTNHLSSLL